jgi:4-hydroxy-4-methyl-2-oxoglutarate aldolase
LPVTIHSRAPSTLTDAEIEPWRKVPVAIAVDLARDIGQIDPAIRPLLPPGRQPALFGRAVTALCEPPDFGAVLHALDHVKKGDVLVIAAAGAPDFAMIGEILCGHLRRIGAAGVICDGAVRDVAMIASWPDFSVFSRHITPRGPSSAERGAVNRPVVFGGQIVTPGDVVIGDDDGLVALSSASVRTRLTAAQAKMAKETEWIAGLEQGRSVAELFGLGAEVKG